MKKLVSDGAAADPPGVITIPPRFTLRADRVCPRCGRRVVRVDDFEGTPLYSCPRRHLLRRPDHA